MVASQTTYPKRLKKSASVRDVRARQRFTQLDERRVLTIGLDRSALRGRTDRLERVQDARGCSPCP